MAILPRLQLFELEDQPWLPSRVRDLATDYLRFVERRFRLHLHALPVLSRAVRESGSRQVVDLCSGGGGPIGELQRALGAAGVHVRVVLTDLYPNAPAFGRVRDASGGAVDYIDSSVDARRVPQHLEGLRTFFNAFHHFAPDDAVAILESAARDGQPVAVMEIPERSLQTLLPLILTPLFVWLATPFIRPFSWARLVLTYVVPAVPLVCLWDGVVSQLRAYRPEELEDLAARVQVEGYVWEAGTSQAPSVPGRVTFLLGRPA